MSEVRRGPGPLQVGQEGKCPKTWLHWEVRGESPRHQSPLEMEEARRSVKGASVTHEETDLLRGPVFTRKPSQDKTKSDGNYCGKDGCASDLWDAVLEEVSVWFIFSNGGRRDQHLVVNRRRGQLPTGTPGDDTRRFGCQVNGT